MKDFKNILGTIARTGIAGFFTGNTAERLPPQIPCSVLALKPPELRFSLTEAIDIEIHKDVTRCMAKNNH